MLQQKKTLYAFESDAFEQTDSLSLWLEEPTPDQDNPVLPTGAPGEPYENKSSYSVSQ